MNETFSVIFKHCVVSVSVAISYIFCTLVFYTLLDANCIMYKENLHFLSHLVTHVKNAMMQGSRKNAILAIAHILRRSIENESAGLCSIIFWYSFAIATNLY